MKLFTLVAVLAIALSTASAIKSEGKCSHQISEATGPSLHDLEVAAKCVMTATKEVKDLTSMVETIISGDFVGTAVDIYNTVKQSIDLLNNCKSLFCFGPSFERCQKDHPGNACTRYGDIVYPECASGYTNWDCCVCATTCPAGFRDDGLYCAKPNSYGRGAGYAIWDQARCEHDNPQGCEKNGAIWYPKCQEGFHNVGCCVCSPNCPSGWDDIGVSCKKPASYGRGVGYAVSFGLECIEENEVNQLFNTCPLKKNQMALLKQEVDTKMAEAHNNPNQTFPEFPDQMKELSQLTDLYKQYCMNFNTTTQ